jgi:hypothetical protein
VDAVRRPKVKDCNPDWTRAVKEVLRRKGKEKAYDVYPDREAEGKGNREWLLDLIWYRREKGTIDLAVESEWGSEAAVLDDFEKLLCIKAPLKAMIYCTYNGSFVAKFEDYMAAFDRHLEGEKYLLVEFAGTESRACLFEVRRDGHLTGIKFSELNLKGTMAA